VLKVVLDHEVGAQAHVQVYDVNAISIQMQFAAFVSNFGVNDQ